MFNNFGSKSKCTFRSIGLLHVVFENEVLQRYCFINKHYVYDDLMIAHKHVFMWNNCKRSYMFRSINYN